MKRLSITRLSIVVGLAALTAGVAAQRGGGAPPVGGECPKGMTLVRVGTCQAPEFPPPSIVDYRPKSTLVTPEHLVPRAKFPVIDVHAHIAGMLKSPQSLAAMIGDADKLNLGVLISADNSSGSELVSRVQAVSGSPYKDRVRILAGVNFSNVGPGWADKAIAQLETDMKSGAIGIGEISKSLGLFTRKPDGTRLRVDDPELDPLWDACGRMGVTVFIHTAEPQEFFEPPDMHNERWLELSLFSDRRHYDAGDVKFEELMTERDHVFKKHPNTKFIAAHLGWYANDLGRAAKLLDDYPNVSVELGAILYDLGRQPRGAHDFFVKYQDRILFGKDTWAPVEYPYYWRVFETKDEYFDYYRDYHAFWKLYGMDLPDDVLKKVYYKNALKLFPGVPQANWPK
jgi:predicted TIM-barrel fold metal-dependent hydrolase